MLSNYAGPHQPLWKDNPGWIKKINQQILAPAESKPGAVVGLNPF